ncbi:MAG: hypothetical protein ACK5ES_19690, partial [Planctomyces sp.]
VLRWNVAGAMCPPVWVTARLTQSFWRIQAGSEWVVCSGGSAALVCRVSRLAVMQAKNASRKKCW